MPIILAKNYCRDCQDKMVDRAIFLFLKLIFIGHGKQGTFFTMRGFQKAKETKLINVKTACYIQ